MNYTELLESIRDYVTQLFQKHENPVLIYHNLSHTEQVVHNVISVSTHHRLSEEALFIVQAAAWFHDVGYLFDTSAHEQVGAGEAEKFLEAKGVSEAVVKAVKFAILATRMPQKADTIEEKIVCDADLYHLGTQEFRHINKLVREEKSQMCPGSFTKDDWLKSTIALLEHHEYQTAYCRKHLGVQKQKNLDELQEKLKNSAAVPSATFNFTGAGQDAKSSKGQTE